MGKSDILRGIKFSHHSIIGVFLIHVFYIFADPLLYWHFQILMNEETDL